jgi:hypothetical protein
LRVRESERARERESERASEGVLTRLILILI